MDPIGQDVLTKIKNSSDLFKDAIIAGGFLRDDILGGRFKDIDIYYPSFVSNTDAAFGEFVNVLPKLEGFLFKDSLGEAGYKDLQGIVGVYSLDYKETIPVQLMPFKMDDESEKTFPEQLMETFDFNICKCWSDGEEIFVTPEAEKDLTSLTATLQKSNKNGFLKSVERYASWKIKYPELKLQTTLALYSEEDLLEREKALREEIEWLKNMNSKYQMELQNRNISSYPFRKESFIPGQWIYTR